MGCDGLESLRVTPSDKRLTCAQPIMGSGQVGCLPCTDSEYPAAYVQAQLLQSGFFIPGIWTEVQEAACGYIVSGSLSILAFQSANHHNYYFLLRTAVMRQPSGVLESSKPYFSGL